MKKFMALGLCLIFTVSFFVGVLAQEPSVKVLHDCDSVGDDEVTVMCCVVEDPETQTCYEECYFIYHAQ